MNKEELQKKCADLIGVSASEKELAFEVLQEKILEQLKNDSDALRINNLGVFQYKINKEENNDELIFSPQHTGSGSKTLFLRLPVKKNSSSDETIIDDVFSLSIGKPTVPLETSFETGGKSDASFVYIKKKIEERVNEILSGSEFLNNFDLLDDYLKAMNKDELKNKSESESSSLLSDLTKPDPEPEEDEVDPYTKSILTNETELYTYPDENIKKEENEADEDDEFLGDYETLKNLSEEEADNMVPDDKTEDLTGEDDSDAKEEDSKTVEETPEQLEKIELPKIEDEIESVGLDDKEIFDLEKTLFNNPEPEENKFDWSWGDELKSDIPNDDIPEVRSTKIAEDKPLEEKKEPEEPSEKVDDDPFGSLEKTIEQDPEFRTITSEHIPQDDKNTEDDYRITNLTKPRKVPPKPKTRFTRLTSPVEEPEEKTNYSETKEKEEVYRSFRERNSNSNIFVIAGIIVILIVIIYFAFSIGNEPSKDIIKPSNQVTQNQADDNVVTSEQPVTKSNTNDRLATDNQSTTTQPDNSSKVEEIRISNLIFRRGNEYNVQVSSWRSSIKADAEVQRFKAKGYKAFVVQAYLPSKGGTWHRVRIGGFKSEQEARNFLNNTQL